MICENKVKVGVGFATGRKNFIKTLEYQFDNWKKKGLLNNPSVSINVFIAYDTDYNNVEEKEFLKVPKRIKDGVDSMFFIGKKEVNELVRKHRVAGKISEIELKELFDTHEYGKLRNTILYSALENKMDYLLFLDDDEYPIVPLRNKNNGLEWVEQDILGTHLKYIKEHDVTFGYHCGYISPIPYFEIGKEIPEKDFRDFIEAVSNDIIDWPKMKKLITENKGINYGDEKIVNEKPAKQIKQRNGVKWFAGSNICLNLRKLKNDATFYNPPNARGEDTFFCTCLKKRSVLRIPVYSFHDGFLKYTSILDGVLPEKLEQIEHEGDEVKMRFFKACIGWLRYKPLLIYVIDKLGYHQKISLVKKQLNKSVNSISSLLDMSDFKQVKAELSFYASEVKTHYAQFQRVQKNWKKITQSFIVPENVELLEVDTKILNSSAITELVELAESVVNNVVELTGTTDNVLVIQKGQNEKEENCVLL